jgi:hypothetical protein
MPSTTRNGIDTWLPRLSHLAQVGLFLLTLGALYYTVLPLYQKAVLEETIARKEVELKQVNSELNKVYVNLRRYIVSQFVFQAGAQCSGMLDEALMLEQKSPLKVAQRIFAIDVGTCLNQVVANQAALRELRPADHVFFVQQVSGLIPKLAEKRRQAMREHQTLPERARADSKLVPPPTGLRAEAIDLSEDLYRGLNRAMVSGRKLEPPESFEQQRRELSIELAQDKIAARYAEQIRSEVSSLRAVQWLGDKWP